MNKLLSFHNDPKIKDKYLSRVKSHQIADNIIQRQGWTGQKGCAIGCTLENYDRTQYPIELGIPIEIAILEDFIFEGLDLEIAKKWPLRFLNAVPIGKNLEMIFPQFGLWLLETYISEEYKKIPVIASVIEIYQKLCKGEIDRDSDLALARSLDRSLDLALDLDHALDLALALDLDHALDLALALDLDLELARARARALTLDHALELELAIDLDRALDHAHALDQNRNKFWLKCSDKLIEIIK